MVRLFTRKDFRGGCSVYFFPGIFTPVPINNFQKTVLKLLQFLKISNNFYTVFSKHLYDFSVLFFVNRIKFFEKTP